MTFRDIKDPPVFPCKIGTIPSTVYRDRRQTLITGAKIRVREAIFGSKWFEVRVTKIMPDGYFFADRV